MGYNFFENKDCEYYPCHKAERINCLFCFCPLYSTDCGGNCKWIYDRNGKLIKDCSNCIIPHTDGGYEYVIGRLAGKGDKKMEEHMSLEQVIDLDKKYYMNTFGDRISLCFTEGNGIELTSTDGNVYKDFFAGIAVCSLGYNHERLTRELTEQVKQLIHTSSVYYVENQARLAEILVKHSCGDRVFFCSTGAEANEGAIKLAKKYQVEKGNKNKIEFVTLKNSFHGRTLATVAATGQPKYQAPYQPLIEKFVHIDRDDISALENAVNENTAGIMIELIQGESGVNPVSREFAEKAAELCGKNDIALIVDEVQTGIGRTGKLFAYELYDLEPDIVTMAKGLGGGVPIGAFCANEKFASAFKPGDHGTTFGGNPLSTRAGLVVLDELIHGGVLENVGETGSYLFDKLRQLADANSKIADVRGRGLMCGVEFSEPIAKEIGEKLRANKVLVGVVGDRVLRIVPPLIVTKPDIDYLINALKEAI